jgi:acyl-CoA reductase-like NAD-dependent aldehyde dehydrogenase
MDIKKRPVSQQLAPATGVRREGFPPGAARRAGATRYETEVDFAGGIEVPFGGNHMSGYGREKGLAALDAYSRIKSVVARI